MNIIIILLYLLSFAIIWQFVGYPTLMATIALKAKPKNKDCTYHSHFMKMDAIGEIRRDIA